MTTTSMSMSSSQRLMKTNSRSSMTGSPRFSSQTSMGLDDMNIKTWILNASPIDNATYYRILVRRGATSVIKESKRRYTDFLEFKESLLDLFDTLPTCPRCENIAKVVADFEFPKKHYFSSKSKVVINYRMQAFRNFVSLVVGKVFNPSPKCPTCGGQVVTLVLRFLLQNATVLPENQVPRDSVFVRENTMTTPTSTRSDIASMNPRGFNSMRRSVSGPPPVMSTVPQPAAIRSEPGFKATSIGRFSVPNEELEERFSSRESSMARPQAPPAPQPQPEFRYDLASSSNSTLNRLSSEPVLRRPAGNDVYFDSFLADKDDPMPMKQFLPEDVAPHASEGPAQQHSASRTSVSSSDDDEDDEEIDLTGLHSSVDPVKPAAKPAPAAWSGWDTTL